MQTYIGTKIVNAHPMSEGNFLIEIKGEGTVRPTQMVNYGYLVVYEDGYKSWSPKNVFECCYRQITSKEESLIMLKQRP